MKLLLGLFFFLTTSMSPVPHEMIASHECVPMQEISCIVETSFVCPPGYIDGCITNETRTHECLPVEEGPSCALEMALNCPENFGDGCLTGESPVHFCVPVKGPLCKKNIAFSCPSGFEDSCSR